MTRKKHFKNFLNELIISRELDLIKKMHYHNSPYESQVHNQYSLWLKFNRASRLSLKLNICHF